MDDAPIFNIAATQAKSSPGQALAIDRLSLNLFYRHRLELPLKVAVLK